MAQRIYKYPVLIMGHQHIALPLGYKVLSVANQGGTVCLWAIVDDNVGEQCMVSVHIVGTGNPVDLPVNCKFIGTVLVREFVWHVFVEGH